MFFRRCLAVSSLDLEAFFLDFVASVDSSSVDSSELSELSVLEESTSALALVDFII